MNNTQKIEKIITNRFENGEYTPDFKIDMQSFDAYYTELQNDVSINGKKGNSFYETGIKRIDGQVDTIDFTVIPATFDEADEILTDEVIEVEL